MKKLLILANNMSSQMADVISAVVETWLQDDRRALILPSGLDLGIPVSIEAILLEVSPVGSIIDAMRLGVSYE